MTALLRALRDAVARLLWTPLQYGTTVLAAADTEPEPEHRFARQIAAETDPGRRAAWRMLADTENCLDHPAGDCQPQYTRRTR